MRSLFRCCGLGWRDGIAPWRTIVSAQNSETSDCGMPYRCLSLGDFSSNLPHDFAFLCSLHESHLLGVVQSHGPGMLQAGHGCDRSVVIPFVSTSEWPTPVRAAWLFISVGIPEEELGHYG